MVPGGATFGVFTPGSLDLDEFVCPTNETKSGVLCCSCTPNIAKWPAPPPELSRSVKHCVRVTYSPLLLSAPVSCVSGVEKNTRQVAGYETRFKGARLSFVTVHSAGHEVPAYQPARALKLLSKYLDGSWWGLGGQEDSVADMSNTPMMY